MSSWLVIAPILVPLSGGLAALLVRTQPHVATAVARATSAGLAVAAAALLAAVWTGGPIALEVGGWPSAIAIPLVADHAAVIMIAIAAIAAVAATAHRRPSASPSDPQPALTLVLVAGASGAFLAGDLFNLYVWFEVVIVASIGILVADGGARDRVALRRYVLANLIASALLLLGVGLIYGATGTVHMAALGSAFAALDGSLQVAVASPLVVGFAIKAAAFPLFSWLPGAYAALAPGSAALFSALLTKLGVYALFRTLGGPLASAIPAFQPALTAIACATMVAGVLGALAQTEIRRLLAFHIVSQIGYLLLAVALFTEASGAALFVFLVHVASAKAALFLIAGLIADAGGSHDLRRLGGLRTAHPGLAVLFAVPALALAGLPPLSGFWAKLLVVRAAIDEAAWVAVAVALAVSLLTLLSMAKIWFYAFWRPRPRNAPAVAATARPLRVAPAIALAAIAVAVGLVPEPLLAVSWQAAIDSLAGAAA
jgi:multicomponent Na+:H+ antiporter subunit D